MKSMTLYSILPADVSRLIVSDIYGDMWYDIHRELRVKNALRLLNACTCSWQDSCELCMSPRVDATNEDWLYQMSIVLQLRETLYDARKMLNKLEQIYSTEDAIENVMFNYKDVIPICENCECNEIRKEDFIRELASDSSILCESCVENM